VAFCQDDEIFLCKPEKMAQFTAMGFLPTLNIGIAAIFDDGPDPRNSLATRYRRGSSGFERPLLNTVPEACPLSI